jgi:hypothetical protein
MILHNNFSFFLLHNNFTIYVQCGHQYIFSLCFSHLKTCNSEYDLRVLSRIQPPPLLGHSWHLAFSQFLLISCTNLVSNVIFAIYRETKTPKPKTSIKDGIGGTSKWSGWAGLRNGRDVEMDGIGGTSINNQFLSYDRRDVEMGHYRR